jgi:hypothetical protein
VKTRRPRASLRRTAILAMVLVGTDGCGWIDRFQETADEAIEKAMTRLDRISNDIAAARIGFEDVARDMNETLKDLPKELAREFQTAFVTVAERATQAAGIQARCSTDFVRQRIGSDVRNVWAQLRARLLHQPAPAPRPGVPTVCMPSPDSVSIDFWGAGVKTIAWDGWDLQAMDASGRGLRVRLGYLNAGLMSKATLAGSTQPATPIWAYDSFDIVSASSAYKAVADLTRLGSAIDKKYRKLQLLFGDTVVSEVPLTGTQPPRVGEDTPQLSPLLLYVAPASGRTLQGADREFDENGPQVTFSVCLQVRDGTRVVAVVDYDAVEWSQGAPSGDQTQATGHWEQTVHVVGSGQKILAILADACDRGTFTDTSSDQQVIEGTFFTYQINGRGDGADVGVHTTISGPVGKVVRLQIEG